MELESRYVLARLRAVEERLKGAAETLEISAEEGSGRPSGEYLSGYGRGLMEARNHVKRLREALAALAATD